MSFRLAISYGMIHVQKKGQSNPQFKITPIKFRTYFSVSDDVEINIVLYAQARIAKCSMLTKNLWTVVHRWEVVQQLGKS